MSWLHRVLVAGVSLLLLVGCSTMEVRTDYDTAFDFTTHKKYAIVHSARAGENTLTNDRIINALKKVLDEKSYVLVDKQDADIVFVFHVNVQDKVDIRTDYEMVGYGGFGYGRGFGGGMVATQSAYHYTEGTLVIDALNPKTKKIVWRGIVKDELSNTDATPQEKAAYIEKIVRTLLEKFPPKVKDLH